MNNKKIIICCLFLWMMFAIIGASFAQEEIVIEKIPVETIDLSSKTILSSEDIDLLKKYISGDESTKNLVVTRPSISSDKELSSDEEILQVKAYLKGKAHKEVIPAKNDYVDRLNRGTVYFNPEKGNIFNSSKLKMRNYSFHKVIIPDGTTIEGVNFSQKDPHTDAIVGKNLTFIKCNLKNVEIDPSWTLTRSLSINAREREEDGFSIYEVEKNGKFEEVSREEIISDTAE